MDKGFLRYTVVRRVMYFCLFLLLWQILFSLKIFPEILFPSPAAVLKTLYNELINGSLFIKMGYTLYLIVLGIVISFLLAGLLVIIAQISQLFKDFLKTLISVLDPLPGIALLPMAILWFGIGKAAIIFIMIHSIIWPALLSVLYGFDAVPKMYREVGANIGLSKLRMISDVYVPAAFPSILMGIKNGWARAWRSLIAAEMVFGTTGAIGGLGWDIYIKRSYLDMPGMIATLILLMLLGILIEDILFSTIEKKTVKKWGMTL